MMFQKETFFNTKMTKVNDNVIEQPPHIFGRGARRSIASIAVGAVPTPMICKERGSKARTTLYNMIGPSCQS